MSRLIYFDNNATTLMPASVLKTFLTWTNKGNPSAGYTSAVECRKMMNDFRKYIAKTCGFNIVISEDNPSYQPTNNDFKVIFTSCGSESNTHFIRSTIDSYLYRRKSTPHIIASAIEHKSIIECLTRLQSRGLVELSLIQPDESGSIPLQSIRNEIRSNTILITVMHANNETGAVNDIKAIGKIAHDNNILFHTDAVQTFGKFPLNPIRDEVDAFSISFHKYQGPPGVGALVIRHRLVIGWDLQPLIYGSQNEGLRGGTENIPGIAASFAGLKLTLESRAAKNKKLASMKSYIVTELCKRIPCKPYSKYISDNSVKKNELEIVFISGTGANYLPNTILMSVVKRSHPPICNAKLKQRLESRGIIVSVGSACNTSNPKASHVIYAMQADELIRKGVLRITLGDANTMDECKRFVKEFLLILTGETNC